MNKRIGLMVFLVTLPVMSVSTAALSCNNGGLGQSTCEITQPQEITGETITDSNTDIIVKSGGRLYTDHAYSGTGSANDAKIELTNGDFIVESGGVVHANINISAYNIKVKNGGIIDASGLGYQAVPGKKSNCPTVEAQSGFCTGYGPAGGGGGGSNSGTGSGGGGHAGKGGSYDDSGNSYASSGGGRGPVKDNTYGSVEDPATFGSAGGSFGQTPPNTFYLDEAASYTSTKANIGNAYQYSGGRTETIRNASHGFLWSGQLGKRDDPSHDLADSDRWHPNNNEYRVNNPNKISMGAGGGRIKLVANNKLNNSGVILSNGLDGMGTGNNGYPGSGGAGGSIWISAGGTFGDGTIRASGGDYAEFMDGGESNTGKSGVSAAGGGGYVYYEYSISEQNWDISAEEGSGTVGLDTDFSGNSNKQNPGSRDLVATNGSIKSVIAFSAELNNSIINPNGPFKVNGTAGGSYANVTLNGTQIGSVEPRQSDGFYDISLNGIDINKTENLGNYTLTVSSTISGNTISESFDLSHRNIQVTQDSDYIMKPGEQFTVNSKLQKVKEDGSEGIQKTDYSGKTVNFDFFSGNSNLRSSTNTTNNTGGFSLSDTVPSTKGRKYYTTQDENSQGITGFERKNLSWVTINDSIVDPEDQIKVNGSAHNQVRLFLENQSNSFEQRATLTPDPDGYFSTSVTALNIDNPANFANYTLKMETELNGQTRTETFEVSHREINIQNTPDYMLKAGEDLSLDNQVDFYKEDPANSDDPVNVAYTNGFTFRLLNQSNERISREIDSTGGTYSFNQNILPTRGLKKYRIREINKNGITETIEDQDLYENEEKDLAWVDINTSIVDPGQQIQINGSSPNQVTFELEKPNGNFIDKGSISPDPDGYFEVNKQSLTRSIIDSEQDLGNYTLRINTSLNGQVRTEKFEISHREIEIDNNPDFFLKPDENLQFSDFTDLIMQDGSGGKTRLDYATQDLSFNYFNQSNNLNSTKVKTNGTGGYSIFHDLQPTPGLKRFTLETENQNGIDDIINDNDIYNINNRSLAWTGINDSIVDPGQQIQINGSAHNQVTVELEKPDGSYIERGSFTPGPRGFFEEDIQVLTRTVLQDYQDLGNYTLRINTTLNGETRAERFNLSYRELEFYHDTDYFRRPGEQFTISGSSNLTKEDGAGGSETVPFANKDFNFLYFNSANRLRDSTEPTDGAGEFSVTDTMASSKGKKYYKIEDVNENGINDLRSDNDLRNSERKNLGVVSINDYIVNSGEEIKVNGTAYNDVEITFNGSEVSGSPVTPDASTGFFNNTFEVPNIPETSGLGNQTLKVNTTLNGKERSEAFDVSLRGIRFDLTNTYPRRVNPGENFTVSGFAHKYVSDDSGGSKAIDYSDEEVKIVYRDENGEIQTKTDTTNSTGGFKIQDFESPLNAGDRTIEISTVNSEGIRQDREETVKTRIRVENSSTTSPSKRLFKDSDLEQTRFINPTQEVDLSVGTRKSLDFVKEVYANVTLPDGSQKQVELNAQGVLGDRLDSESDWDSGNTSHLTHSSIQKGIDSDQLRLGYETEASDKLVLNMPMESASGAVKDVSGQGNDAVVSSSSSVSRQVDGVFSTNATELNGGYLEIQDSQALNFASNFTFSTWVKTTDSGPIYSRETDFGEKVNPALRILSDGRLEMEVKGDSSSNYARSSTVLNNGKWHHVGARYNGTHISVYVDGSREGINSFNDKLVKFSTKPRIGETTKTTTEKLNGKIDEFKAFNQSLKESRIKKLAQRKGSFQTETITTDKQVIDILKLVNFEGGLNSQEIQVQALSDYDNDGLFEEESDVINLSDGTQIRSVSGFGNYSKDFRLNFTFSTSNASESPVLSQIDFKARKDPKIKWTNSKPIEGFFEEQYGLYNVDYGAEDYGGNYQDTLLEESNFSVRDIRVQADHKDKLDPGDQVNITGNATLITGDGNGGKHRQNFTGSLNILFEDTVRGRNQIKESRTFEDLKTGESRTIPVNGTQTPQNAKITFLGKYSGIDEKIVWNESQDWDAYQSRTGMTHSIKKDSPLKNSSLTLGYASQDLGGSALESYYTFDDNGLPANDSKGSKSLQKTGSPEPGASGVVSTDAIRFSGGEGLTGSSPFSSTTKFTVNAWVKPSSVPSSSGHLGSGTGDPYTVFAVKDKLTLQIADGGRAYGSAKVNGNTYSAKTDTGTVSADEWSMVTLTYNGDRLKVSTGRGLLSQNIGTVSFTNTPDLTGKQTFAGYRSDIDANSFKGKIDELRVYSRALNPAFLRNRLGDTDSQQSITTSYKSFSETIKSGSLVLEADVETNGQRAQVVVQSNQGGTSDPITLSNDKTRYQITGALTDAKKYSLKVEMDSNKTHAPVVNDLRLIRRFATENPGVDIDGDGIEEANYTQSRILPGQSQTVTLENLTKGVNTADFSTKNGAFNAEINYTEILVPNKKPEVDVNSSGEFSTSFTVPSVSGTSNIDYYTTNPKGIQGIAQTDLTTSLLFSSSTVSDLENGDRTVDPENRFQVNATLAPHTNPIERMWGVIETPSGDTFERDLEKSTYSGDTWNFTESIKEVYSGEGEYTVSLKALDTTDLRELESPQVSFNVTNGTITVRKSDQTVGLGRKFSVNGTVRQNLANKRVNATVNITVPATGETDIVQTDNQGFYNTTVTAPGSTGNYKVVVNSEDEDNITAGNSTTISVEDSTDIRVSVPDFKVPIQDVTLDSGVNRSVPINITNEGDTEVKNIEVYAEALPDASESTKILQDRGGRDWRTVNQTYNVSSGSEKQVDAVVDVSKASTQADYSLNISTKFTTSGGVTKTTTNRITMEVTLSKLPLFQNNVTVKYEDGYTGNLIPPDGSVNLTLENQGTGTAQEIGWTVENQMFREVWIDSFFKSKDGSYARGTGDSVKIFEINGNIPEGTPPGNYSTLLKSYSKNPDRTNSANFTVEVENSPKWGVVVVPLKDQVEVPPEINASNPVEVGTIELDSKEDLFNLTLKNTGNRDLEWETQSRTTQGDDSNLFYTNETAVPNHGSETFSSTIDSLPNNQYDINSPTAQVGYTTEFATDIQTDYSANISIDCVNPSGCGPQEVNIPLHGTVKDPAPRVTDIEIPEITGRGNAVYINGTVSDNAGTTNTEGLKSMNITVTKYLDTTEEEVRVGNDDFNINSPQGTFSEKIVPSKLGRDLSSNDHKYGIRFEAVDNNGNRRVTEEYNFTVRDKANLDLSLNRSDIVLENVTANSGDTATLSGTVSGGEVDAEDVSLTLSIGETDPVTADEDNINFTSQDSFIDLGEIDSGENKSFSADIQAAENTGFIPDYFAGVTPAWTNPDGSSESGTESTSTVSAARNIKLSLSGTQSLTVPHNSTTEGQVVVESSGNAPVNDVNLECIGCSSVLGITGYNATGFDLEGGGSRAVGYNISAEKYLEPQTVQIDIKATSERRTAYLNDTTVSVPEDRSVNLKPENQSEVIPANQGVVNVTEISAKNTGNVPLQPLKVENPVDLQFYLGQSQVNAFEEDISPGETVDIQAKSDTDEIEAKGTTPYNFTVNPSSSTTLDSFNTANVTLFVQDIGFNQKSQNKTQSIVDGDSIEAVFNLTKSDQAIGSGNNVDITLRASEKSFDISENYDSDNQLWKTEFEAPDIEDGVNHTFSFEVSSSEFRSTIDTSKEVSYKDITPPEFSNLTAEPVTESENSTIEVSVLDNSNLVGQDVTANIVDPEGSSSQLKLDSVGSTRLSETQSKKWVGEFNATTTEGLYNVSVKATDSAGNTGESGSEYFRVFRPLNVSGDAGEPADSTEIRLIDQGGETTEKVDPENGTYNETIKSGSYDEAEIIVTEEKVANLDSLSASRINQSPPKFDARINDNLVNVDKEYLSGFGIVSQSFENVSGELSFDYSGDIDRIDYQGNLQIMKCEEYNISKATPCQSGYETISKNNTFINAETRNLYIDDISGFSSYILVEDESSSQSNNLNVNLTGELGDLGNLSELSNLDSILEQIASNTEDSGDTSTGGSGDTSTGSSGDAGGGGSTGSSGSSGESGALGDLASQLNESDEDELAIGNSKISISVQPGQEKSTAISIQNPKSESVDIQLEVTENIRDMLSYEREFNLSSGEFRTVRISVNTSNKTRLKEYSGFIQIRGGETDRSIPVNIDIVGAENRLLDVSLEPTVDNFRPGKTARLKLSFSNQGFSRAVDAETTVEIVDITDDETVAKETHTYAVQTTLDKVVSLDIPKDTDLGTYEARASVEYSNIPGNRSATAVGQVKVQRPFWQQQTLGLANVYWLGIVLILIAAGSGSGYWYYRKKKLEAKRSRFEEQVDNDAIPSEAGRTAFVGELSEIGTRAFIDLNDLMTHCLTAGATGAGKSVAAQVIVEEALEQGVNVIVLDPTGQWSGYLDKNENDEFFAFYDDFGMKEGDARSYQGNIRAVDADQDTIDITDIMRPEGDEGSIHVFSMHKLENAELEEYLSDTIQQIFDYNPEEKDELKTLIVYDEAHRVLEKFGGTGRGVKMLERGAREFRKWGTGMLMISQVIDDFPEEVRANIGTQIQMRTEYEGDLDRIERKYGNNITQGVTKADTGTGMLQNSSYNHGRPYFVDFRPVKHSPERLSDEELDKFEKYNRRVDEIEDMISILEDQGEDIFEYQSQLKLVKKNIRKRSFNLVDTYLDELEEDLNDALNL